VPWKPDYITVAEFNAFARSADALDDVETALWITGASRLVDDHLHRQFGTLAAPTARVYRGPAFYDPRLSLWCVEIDDVQVTTGMTIAGVALASSGWVLLPDNSPLDGKPYTMIGIDQWSCPTMPLTVVAQYGWTAIPSQVKGAVRLQVNRLASRRNTPLGLLESPDGGPAARVLARLDPDVAVSLRGLGRTRWPS
jgi:hypothetical protein